jgi:hypothetical protein
MDMEGGERQRTGGVGTGEERRRCQRRGRGVEARAGPIVYLFFSYRRGSYGYLVGGEASSASRGPEAENLVVYLCRSYAMAAKRPYAIPMRKQTNNPGQPSASPTLEPGIKWKLLGAAGSTMMASILWTSLWHLLTVGRHTVSYVCRIDTIILSF